MRSSLGRLMVLSVLIAQSAAAGGLSPQEAEARSGVLMTQYLFFTLGQYCAENDVAFSAEEIEALQGKIKEFTDKTGLERSTIDKLWNGAQQAFAAKKATFGPNDCAIARQQLATSFPSAFAGDARPNPF
ncbi:hypothetical protein [Rhizobium leguminosarum]|uniref:hypothetical protein n=1 Tax=Rhizobium leguminosarum TaxID=384 RepID=UPI001C926D03|nr:hypothetical protein [Rhizobium leguminosarum]MBY3043694.1 hypothetical protein [Rhizobium leguminosarum]